MKVILFLTSLLSFLSFSVHAEALNSADKNPSPPTTKNAETTHTPSQSLKINLNTADAKTLSKSIKGIGIKRAESIVKYRESLDGGFKSVTDLAEVPLIGKNFVIKHSKEIEEMFTVR